MASTAIAGSSLKRAVREARTETLHEQRGLRQEVVGEALEDFALAKAICQGKKTKPATREQVFSVLWA